MRASLHAAGLQRIAPADLESLGPVDELLAHFLHRRLIKPPIRKMPVRAEHAGQLARFSLRPIQAAGHIEAGIAFQIDLLDRVAIAIDPAVNHGIGGVLRRHRPQPSRHQQLPPHMLGPLLPRLRARAHRERKIPVQILQRPEPAIVGQLALRQHARRVAASSDRVRYQRDTQNRRCHGEPSRATTFRTDQAMHDFTCTGDGSQNLNTILTDG